MPIRRITGTPWILPGEEVCARLGAACPIATATNLPYPGAPERDKHEQKIQALVDAGVRLIINLMEPDETDHRGRPFVPYDDLVGQLCPDAKCVRSAAQDLSVPSVEQMQTVLDTIDESLRAGRAVYVHCWGGVGRTGTVVGCWLLRHDLANSSNVLDTIMNLRKEDR
jgi:hypothetical protein